MTILIFCVLASMTINTTAQPGTIPEPDPAAPIWYAIAADVVSVDEAGQLVTIQDEGGELWTFYGDGFAVGDRVNALMSDNGTPEQMRDDEIVTAWTI